MTQLSCCNPMLSSYVMKQLLQGFLCQYTSVYCDKYRLTIFYKKMKNPLSSLSLTMPALIKTHCTIRILSMYSHTQWGITFPMMHKYQICSLDIQPLLYPKCYPIPCGSLYNPCPHIH